MEAVNFMDHIDCCFVFYAVLQYILKWCYIFTDPGFALFRKPQAGIILSESSGAESIGGKSAAVLFFVLFFPSNSLALLHNVFCFTSRYNDNEYALAIIINDSCIYLFQFNFVNCFASLFYIAFLMQDMVLLRQVSEKAVLTLLLIV